MADYIRRKAAIAEILSEPTDAHYPSWYAEKLKQIPPADVRPVKEGHWVKARGNWCTPGGDPVWECSECGKGVHVYGVEHGTYSSDIADGQWVSCPNCGADMRGIEKSE